MGITTLYNHVTHFSVMVKYSKTTNLPKLKYKKVKVEQYEVVIPIPPTISRITPEKIALLLLL